VKESEYSLLLVHCEQAISEKYVVINLWCLYDQFQSHQIFHVLVIAAAFVHYHGISEMAMYRMTVGECTTQNAAALAFWCHHVAGFAATTLENHKTPKKLIPHNYVPRQTLSLEWHSIRIESHQKNSFLEGNHFDLYFTEVCNMMSVWNCVRRCLQKMWHVH